MIRRHVIVGVALLVASSCTGGSTTSPSSPTTSSTSTVTSGWKQYIDRQDGFSFRYPPAWHLDAFRNGCMVSFSGAMVSNVAGMYHNPQNGNSCSFPPSMDSLPSDGVVVMTDVMYGGGAIIGGGVSVNTPLPLTMDQLKPANGFRRSVGVTFHHLGRYAVSVWMGDRVSPADRASTAQVLASIEPWQPPQTAPSYGTCVGGWERQQPGSVGPYGSSLNGIDLTSPTDGWAVGAYTHRIPGEAAGTNGWPEGVIPAESTVLTEHWDGQSWQVVAAPDPNLSTRPYEGGGSTFMDVADISPDDAWAVGGGGNYGLTEHWDGQAWHAVPSPKVNLVNTTLVGVDGTGPSDAWAIGSGGLHGKIGPIIEHWDGSRWRVSPVPDVGNRYSTADGVSASGPEDAWVVGQSWDKALTLHWDGSSWRSVPSPVIRSPRLTGVADLGRDDAWAVGATYADVNGRGPSHALVEHWDGSRWSVATLPDLPNDTTLIDVAASSPDDVWAIGWANDRSGQEVQIALHFDGNEWSSVPAPTPGPTQGWYVGLSATPGTAWTAGRVSPEVPWGSELAYLARTCA